MDETTPASDKPTESLTPKHDAHLSLPKGLPPGTTLVISVEQPTPVGETTGNTKSSDSPPVAAKRHVSSPTKPKKRRISRKKAKPKKRVKKRPVKAKPRKAVKRKTKPKKAKKPAPSVVYVDTQLTPEPVSHNEDVEVFGTPDSPEAKPVVEPEPVMMAEAPEEHVVVFVLEQPVASGIVLLACGHPWPQDPTARICGDCAMAAHNARMKKHREKAEEEPKQIEAKPEPAKPRKRMPWMLLLFIAGGTALCLGAVYGIILLNREWDDKPDESNDGAIHDQATHDALVTAAVASASSSSTSIAPAPTSGSGTATAELNSGGVGTSGKWTTLTAPGNAEWTFTVAVADEQFLFVRDCDDMDYNHVQPAVASPKKVADSVCVQDRNSNRNINFDWSWTLV